MSCSNHVQRWKSAANGQGKFVAARSSPPRPAARASAPALVFPSTRGLARPAPTCVIDQTYNKKRPSDFEGLAFLSAAAEFYLSGILTFASGRLSR